MIYCRLPGFTVVSSGKYLAGGLQSSCTANLIGAQYNYQEGWIVYGVGIWKLAGGER